uniref:CBM49 domain-containing protein n=1 Tax=Strongyloides venezuelensis TaxID=75913 RepID=A0A0K0FS70_STRVS
MLLKLFTAVVIISISKVFLCLKYYNNRSSNIFNVTVVGTPWWNDETVKPINVTLRNKNGHTVYNTITNITNNTQFLFSKSTSNNLDLDDFFVRLDYNCSNTPFDFPNYIPNDCMNWNDIFNNKNETLLKSDHLYCDFKGIYLSCEEDEKK